jgi:hypothetical protein
MRTPQAGAAPARLALAAKTDYLNGNNQTGFIMFSRIFRRGDAYRRLFAELARLGDRRTAGVLIAHLGR